MAGTVVEGERIYLRPVQLSDATQVYSQWLNDPLVVQFTESRFKQHTVDDVRAYIAAQLKTEQVYFFAIVNKSNGQHIGNIKIHRVDARHQHAEISLLIGDRSCWGRGLGTEAIRLITDFAFFVLKLHKVYARCYAVNVGSIKAFEKAGFSEEGRQKEQFLWEGSYVDGLILGRVNEA